MDKDTIAAIATPRGTGGIGVIRLSGPLCTAIAEELCATDSVKPLQPRVATLARFHDNNSQVIDTGIALHFPTPNSFTGEDVLELQAHGGRVVLDLLLQRVLALGSRLARPGEFTERAFLNGKLDLAQAEAVSDLIESGSAAAARAATRSLQGEFSSRVRAITEQLIGLRVYMEAALDFPEEEIDFLQSDEMRERAADLKTAFKHLIATTRQGRLLRDGLTVVIAGEPNAGKSSLMNRLTGEPTAIVTDISGTTRDLLREQIEIDGLPVTLVDTAGLRDSTDTVEKEGIRRALQAVSQADRVLWVEDIAVTGSTQPSQLLQRIADQLESVFERDAVDSSDAGQATGPVRVDILLNKIDLQDSGADGLELTPGFKSQVSNSRFRFENVLRASALSGEGIDALRDHLKKVAGFDAGHDDVFIARRRHIEALQRASDAVTEGFGQLDNHNSPELAAEDFRLAQQALGEITGEFSSDDLLGRIFAGFCIGK